MIKKIFDELRSELVDCILPYWTEYAKDTSTGGFYGAISNTNVPNQKEWRGIVMVSRFLWTYSAAARFLSDESYMEMADYAHAYMMKNFHDPYYGGMYWSVNADGTILSDKKQTFGNAYAIYALSEYAAAIKEIRGEDEVAENIMGQALSVFSMLEKHASDEEFGGYFEALNRDWSETEDTKLSEKDIDCSKSMNTNLHVMEAYTNLYRTLPSVCPDKKNERKDVGKALGSLLQIHLSRILAKTYHLVPYFDRDWTPTGPRESSFGHDIEASWLLWDAANELKNIELKKKVKPVVIRMAQLSLLDGFDPNTGGFDYSADEDGIKDTTRIWWTQAEAINGFYNAWEMTWDSSFEEAVEKIWEWVKKYQKNTEHGEWYWAVSDKGKPAKREPKGGNWKTCYHNARCCMELLRRYRAKNDTESTSES